MASTYQRDICWPRWEMRMLEVEENVIDTEDEDEEGMGRIFDDANVGGGSLSSHWDLPSSHVSYLSDSTRLKFFYQTIASNIFKDKVVIDAGCGAGALSILLAKAGARHVVAVERSAQAAEMARRNVEAGGMSQKVTVIEGNVEDLTLKDLPDQQKVDAIIHDGFGPMLLSPMTYGLVVAKRKLLKPDGILSPAKATLHVAGVEDKAYLSNQKETCQDLVPGIDLSPGLMPSVVLTPRVSRMERASSLFTTPCDLFTLDLNDMSTSKQVVIEGYSAPFELTATRDERLMALICWLSFASPSGQVFDGRPDQESSKSQLFLNFPKSLRLAKGDVIQGLVTVTPLYHARASTVSLTIQFQGSTAQCEYRLTEYMAETIL